MFGPSLVKDTRYLFLAFSVTQVVWLGVWMGPWNRLSLRRMGYHFYYRFFGPYCTANIAGVLQVDATLSDGAVLDEVHRLTKDVWKDAKVETRLNNRVIIRLGEPSLTATVVARNIDDDDGEYLLEQIQDMKDSSERLIVLLHQAARQLDEGVLPPNGATTPLDLHDADRQLRTRKPREGISHD